MRERTVMNGRIWVLSGWMVFPLGQIIATDGKVGRKSPKVINANRQESEAFSATEKGGIVPHFGGTRGGGQRSHAVRSLNVRRSTRSIM